MKKRKLLRKQMFNKARLSIYVALVSGMLIMLLLSIFFDKYALQSPILIHLQLPIRERIISPVPNINKPTVIHINNTEPDIHVITPTPKPSVSPTPKKPKMKTTGSLGIVQAVYAEEIDNVQAHDEMIADYIKSKAWDYSIAIRLAKSENFWNKTKSFDCSRIGPMNKDGSYDYGLFQINTVHKATLAKMGMTMDDMLDCKKNIDFAFGHVYTTRTNWSAWSAFNNGSYLGHDEQV